MTSLQPSLHTCTHTYLPVAYWVSPIASHLCPLKLSPATLATHGGLWQSPGEPRRGQIRVWWALFSGESIRIRPRTSSPIFVTLPSNSPFYNAVFLALRWLASFAYMSLLLKFGFQAFVLFPARCYLWSTLLQGCIWLGSRASHQSWHTQMRILPFQGQSQSQVSGLEVSTILP